jgi:hypothetical protein
MNAETGTQEISPTPLATIAQGTTLFSSGFQKIYPIGSGFNR